MITPAGDQSELQPVTSRLSDRTKAHRQLLANLDGYADSSSDQDDTTDDEATHRVVVRNDDDPDHLMGVSMGKAQTRLKSAQTPAAEKTKALEESGHYFTAEPEQLSHSEHNNDASYLDKAEIANETEPFPPVSTNSSSTGVGSGGPPSPWKAFTLTQGSSMSKVFGGESVGKTRRRASSGPTALLNSIKKLLPDLPSPLSSRFSPTSPAASHDAPDEAGPRKADSPRQCLRQKVNASDAEIYESVLRSSVDSTARQTSNDLGSTESSSSVDDAEKRPPNLRRTTSDNSLYLRKAVTGGSDFDDTTVYANVADMPNSRFKAITDSLQDSGIRLPRFPGALLGAARMSISHTDSNTTKENTELNRGTPRDAILDPQRSTGESCSHAAPSPKVTKHPLLKEALSRTTGDVVILGGYRGSILRSAEPPHQQVWIPVKVGLNLRKVDLEVGLDHEDEERMTEKIIPSGILSHIGPIDISRRLLRKVGRCPNVRSKKLRLHDWGYDWRLSPHRIANQLISFLESLECNKPGTLPSEQGALVIAHSLGGLITRHAVNRRPELFRGVVFAGVPQNCVNILGPLRNGDDVLISSRVLTAQVNFTLRTSYALLPENGRCFINKETGERYDLDFFDVNTWEEFRLSPCINPPLMPKVPVKRKSLVGSISESISSFTPSLPTRKGTWLSKSGTNEDVDDENVSTDNDKKSAKQQENQPQSLRERASEAKDEVGDKIKSTAERLPTSPDLLGNRALEPSMKPSSSISSPTSGPASKDNHSLWPSWSMSSSASPLSPSSSSTISPSQSITPTISSSTSSSKTSSIATTVTLPKEKAHSYLQRTLGEIQQFKRELRHNPSHQDANLYPPFAILYGRSVPTVYAAKVSSREAIKYTDAYDDLAFASGDGVVLASAAQLPAGYRYVKGGRVKSERGHVGLLGDLEGVGTCLGAVVEGRRRGIGLGTTVPMGHADANADGER